MIPFAITMLVFLLGIYYLTIFAHFFGANVFGKVKIHVGLSLIPFFYWFKKEDIPVTKKVIKNKKVNKKLNKNKNI